MSYGALLNFIIIKCYLLRVKISNEISVSMKTKDKEKKNKKSLFYTKYKFILAIIQTFTFFNVE